MGLGGTLKNINGLFTLDEKLAIQGASMTCATLSVIACLISIYWFVLLQRNFRRSLIMLLLLADFWKSFWYMVFPAVSISVGGIKTGSVFCSVGGYLLQTGMTGTDCAILTMSVHMTLQIFHTDSKFFGPDGLYRIRYGVYVAWLAVPCTVAALAFINHTGGYLSQGAFCSLPIRPFWYRLALAWIPRYLVWGYAIVTACRVYRHVGSGLRLFGHKAGDSSERTPHASSVDRNSHVMTNASKSLLMNEKDDDVVKDATINTLLSVPGDGAISHSRRPSAVRFDLEDVEKGADSLGHSEKSDSNGHMPNTLGSTDDDGDERMHNVPLTVGSNQATMGSSRAPRYAVQDQSTAQRQLAIKRQVRLLFIYPVVYGLMLVIPFINHCFNYSDYYANHPIFSLTLLASVCWSSMGLADCLCFSLREQPWKHIHGSDGTFWGSFKFWEILGLFGATNDNAGPRFNTGAWSTQADNGGSGVRPARPGSKGSARKMLANIAFRKPPARNRDFSGRSDRAMQAAEDAATRLELERAERTKSMISKGMPSGPTSPTKEWFERPMSGMSHQSEESRLSKQVSRTSPMHGGQSSLPEEDEPNIVGPHAG